MSLSRSRHSPAPRRPPRARAPLIAVALGLSLAAPAEAGVTNPDISVIGQPFLRETDDRSNPDHGRLHLDPGETEFDFNAALNPYANGVFVVSLAPRAGVDLEEGYFTLVRGLPAGLALKGGKYRAGFGRLNPAHPHTYPFSERPRVLAEYLPGEDSFNETGVSLSRLIPVVGDFSLTTSADWLQGDSFHPALAAGSPGADLPGAARQLETRPAFLGRVSGFAMLGDQSALEFGFSGTHGTHDVARGLGTTVLGADAKAKLWTSPRAYLVLQGEGLRLDRAEPDSSGSARGAADYGGYVFADYNFALRYNVGASYERFQQHQPGRPVARAVGLFAGLALMEETTAFRADWNHFTPEGGPAVNRFTLRVIYSMGPHKAHQF